MAHSGSIDSKLVSQAKTFEVVAWIAVVTLGLQLLGLLGLLSLIGPVIDAAGNPDREGLREAMAPVLGRVIGLLPGLIYLGGVIAAAKIFGRVSRGELFSKANSKGLADVGSALLWGAAASALIVPMVQGWTAGEPGFGGMRLESETWVIAVIGGAILVLGRMMTHASRLQGELDSII